MQVQKPDMRNAILAAAKQEFARQGYPKASMRKIASAVGIRVGNIYNYFTGKEDLLRAIVTPAIEALDSIFLESDGLTVGEMSPQGVIAACCSSIFQRNRVAMKILLFGSQGSSFETFKSDYTNRVTEAVTERIRQMSAAGPISDFSIHLLCVWHFTLIEEMLMHDVKASEMRQILADWGNAKSLFGTFTEQ